MRRQEEQGQENRVIGRLAYRGITVHHNSQRRFALRCPTCKTFSVPQGATGETEGLPDLLLRGRWPIGLLAGSEQKAGAAVRFAQIDRMAEGVHVLCFTEEATEAYAACVNDLLASLPDEAVDLYHRRIRSLPDVVTYGTPEGDYLLLERAAGRKGKRISRPAASTLKRHLSRLSLGVSSSKRQEGGPEDGV